MMQEGVKPGTYQEGKKLGQTGGSQYNGTGKDVLGNPIGSPDPNKPEDENTFEKSRAKKAAEAGN